MWYLGVGLLVIGGVFLGYVAGKFIGQVYIFFKEITSTGVHSPLAIMEVGKTDTIRAALFYKPSRSNDDLKMMKGVMTFTIDTGRNVYALSNKGGSITKGADKIASETLTGLAVGKGTLKVFGNDEKPRSYKTVIVHVEVVAKQNSVLDYYKYAVSQAIKYWLNGIIGNFIKNTAKLPPKGLCDEWMNWAIDWLSRNHNNEICRLERAVDTDGLDHNFVRVTMCNGNVYYLDPHGYSDNPVVPQDEWEREHGPPDPIGTYPVWQREPCCSQFKLTLKGPSTVSRELFGKFTAQLSPKIPGVNISGVSIKFKIYAGADNKITSWIYINSSATVEATVKSDAQGKATVLVFGGDEGLDVLGANVDGLNAFAEKTIAYTTLP